MWEALMDSRAMIVFTTAMMYAFLVVVGTIALALPVIFIAEVLQDPTRTLKQWLKKPRIWA